MPDALDAIWERAGATEARFDADEVAMWPDGREALLIEAGVIRRDDNARTVTCDACQDGHIEEVVRIEDPPGSPVRAYIPCPELGRIAVPLERLKQWVVDFEGLAKAVARALALVGKVEEVATARLWALGTMTTAGKRRDVFLARGASWIDAPALLGPHLRGSSDDILLVAGDPPNGEVWSDPPPAVALRHIARMDCRRLAIDRARLEELAREARARPTRRLTRSKIEKPIYAAIEAIRREAATLDEDDPARPRTTQPEVARRLGISRRALQDRLQLLNELRAEAGQASIGWEDILRSQRT